MGTDVGTKKLRVLNSQPYPGQPPRLYDKHACSQEAFGELSQSSPHISTNLCVPCTIMHAITAIIAVARAVIQAANVSDILDT